MDRKLRERDLLWCRALIATLGTEEIEKVTAEFNRIRPDKAIGQCVQRTATNAGCSAKNDTQSIEGTGGRCYRRR